MVNHKSTLTERAVFILLLLFALVAVWLPPYLVQGDGPTHVYNSKILLDIIEHKNIEFYAHYYDFVFVPVPNWFTHVCLAGLQCFFSPFVAEKMFLSFYVIVFPLSFRFFAKQLNPKLSYGSLLIFPLLFHFLYFLGFYNYCFGIAFSLLFVACWLYCKKKNFLQQFMCLMPLSALVFFTSPLGWFLIAVILSGFAVTEIVDLLISGFSVINLRKLAQSWLVIGVSAMVPFFLSVKFMQHHIAEAQYYPETFSRLWAAFFSFEMLNTYCKTEEWISCAFVYTLCSLTLLSLADRIKTKTGFKTGDVLLIGFGLLITIYFIQPLSLSIAGFWIGRMSWLPWLLLILWLCSVEQNKYIKMTMGITGGLVFLLLLFVRLPFQLKNSEAEEDYLSVCKYIPAKSVVLPLSFNNFGCDKTGNNLNETWFFQHAFDFCGAVKPNINLVNYEATTPWFPVQWKQNNNPYKRLGCIECQPPHVSLDGFQKNGCDWQIDYVVTWCMKYNYSERESTKDLKAQMEKDFELIYESPSKRTQLWKNKRKVV